MADRTPIPKLVVCDIDGTLIDRSEAISDHFNTLAALIAKHNIRFSFASGRCLDLLRPYITKLNITEPVIINNGGGARLGNNVLWNDFLNPLYVKNAIHKANEMDMAIFMCDGDSETAYRHNAYIQREIDTFGRYNRFHIPLEVEWPHLELEKVMITDPQRPGRIDDVLECFAPHASALNVVRYDDRHVDIMRHGVTKGRGVARLAAYLGVALRDIMAIGDEENDIDMLQEVGIGVAVGNAKSELKQSADYVCLESHTAGVIEAVRRFCI